MKNLFPSLKQFLLLTTATIVISSAITYTGHAQTYTNVPNDSIIATGTMDVETIYNIVQKNIYPDTIFCHWEKVSAVLPDQWTALFCDNNLCYNGLIQGGDMDSMFHDHDGLMSVHVAPHVNAGMAIIRYSVWDISNPYLKDTLTWIINAYPIGINSVNQIPASILVSGNNLVVQRNDQQVTHIRVCNLEGRVLLESPLTSDKMTFDVSNVPTGIYFVEATGTNTIFTRKVLIQ